MGSSEKILVIDNDPVTRQLLGLICHAYQVEFARDSEEGMAIAAGFRPDLVVIDAKAGGYDSCRRFKSNTQDPVPVLLLSAAQSPEERLQAFASGADDYISLPFDLREFSQKLGRILEIRRERNQLSARLAESNQFIRQMQTTTAQVQAISRFNQACLFCRDLDALADLFFQVVSEFEIRCVLRIYARGGNTLTRAGLGEETQLESDILDLGRTAGRIHQFGRGRALFNWDKLQLLVRNLGDNADIVAILMNGAEVGVAFIEKEMALFRAIEALEAENRLIRTEFSNLFAGMADVLKDTFLSLSLKSALSEEDEHQVHEVVDSYNQAFSRLVDDNKESSSRLFALIRSFRTRSDSTSGAQKGGKPQADSVELF